jgi:hypothetical protein
LISDKTKSSSVALARGKEPVEAAAWGSVAASFCIEQVGVPTLSTDAEGREKWNGESVSARLQEFMGRIERPDVVESASGEIGKMSLA